MMEYHVAKHQIRTKEKDTDPYNSKNSNRFSSSNSDMKVCSSRKQLNICKKHDGPDLW